MTARLAPASAPWPWRAVALAAGLVGVATCAPPGGDPPLGSASQAVVDGTVDSGDPDVVMVELAGGLCSGTLIAPTVVVTAAHCAAPAVGLPAPGRVDLGSQAPWDDVIDVIAIHVDRGYRAPGDGPDLAWLRLARPAPQPVIVVADRLPPGLAEVRVVGFGRTSATGPDTRGVKREGDLAVSAIDGEIIVAGGPAATCQGDSGGAVLVGTSLVGVVSAGDASCTGPTRIQRLDLHAALSAQVVAAWSGPCAADGTCAAGCAPWLDPDCDPCGLDGTCAAACPAPDLDCPLGGGPGDDCRDRYGCESRLCVVAPDDATVRFCSAACDPEAGGADCPAPLAACVGGACLYDGPTAGALGAPCDGAADCRSGLCDPASDRCAVPCGANRACPDGYACGALGAGEACRVDDGCSAGGPASLVVGLASLGLRRRRRRRPSPVSPTAS